MGGRFEDLIALMLENPPDQNEKLPFSNRTETIWGTTLTFLVRSVMMFLVHRIDHDSRSSPS